MPFPEMVKVFTFLSISLMKDEKSYCESTDELIPIVELDIPVMLTHKIYVTKTAKTKENSLKLIFASFQHI